MNANFPSQVRRQNIHKLLKMLYHNDRVNLIISICLQNSYIEHQFTSTHKIKKPELF